jgi:hypothetical protein
MADPHDDDQGNALNDRILDVLVYLPAGIVVTVADEIPRLAARGRDRLGVRVSSARAVGAFVVKAGTDELIRRSGGLWRTRPGHPTPGPGPAGPGPSSPYSRGSSESPASSTAPAPPAATGSGGNGHVPPVSTLSIPGFDTLSASQVVQRLDGLNRMELVSVRAYEASTRGRRTILNRVDQLLDERS